MFQLHYYYYYIYYLKLCVFYLTLHFLRLMKIFPFVSQDDGVWSSDVGPQLDLSGGRPGRRSGECLHFTGPSYQAPVRSLFSRSVGHCPSYITIQRVPS